MATGPRRRPLCSGAPPEATRVALADPLVQLPLLQEARVAVAGLRAATCWRRPRRRRPLPRWRLHRRRGADLPASAEATRCALQGGQAPQHPRAADRRARHCSRRASRVARRWRRRVKRGTGEEIARRGTARRGRLGAAAGPAQNILSRRRAWRGETAQNILLHDAGNGPAQTSQCSSRPLDTTFHLQAHRVSKPVPLAQNASLLGRTRKAAPCLRCNKHTQRAG